MEQRSVALFIPCFMDQLYPETGLNMVKIFEYLNCEVTVLSASFCCGQPAFNAGFIKEAQDVGLNMLFALNKFEGDIIIPGGSCTGYIRGQYPELFKQKADQKNAQQKVQHIYEFTEYLVDVMQVDLTGLMSSDSRITYHDACGASNFCKVVEQPRKLLAQVEGTQLTEMKEAKTCCGFGGTFTVKFSEIASGMAQNKIESALETDAEYIISTDVSCFMHLQSYIDQQKLSLKTLHIVDFLAQSWKL